MHSWKNLLKNSLRSNQTPLWLAEKLFLPVTMQITTITRGNKQIQLIDKRSGYDGFFGDELESKLIKWLQAGKRVLIIGAKTHFASGMICKDCGHIPRCEQCDIPIARHKDKHGELFGLCHLCKTYYPAQGTCKVCHGHELDIYGTWLQQFQEYLEKKTGIHGLVIDRTQANSLPKIKKLLPRIATHQLLLSTGLLTQPPQGQKIDLVIVTHADLGLQVPDIQAHRQNFCFLSEILDKYTTKHYRLYTYQPEMPSIVAATTNNPSYLATREHTHRKRHHYPPYSQLCVLLYKHEIESRLYTTVHKLYQELLFLKTSYGFEQIEIFATPPLLYKAFGKFRYNIVMKGPDLHPFAEIAYSKLKVTSRWFKVDWEPQNSI